MGTDESQPAEARPVLEYQSLNAPPTNATYENEVFGFIGIVLLLLCFPLGDVGPGWAALALLGSLICGAIQVLKSFYRVEVGGKHRVRVRYASLLVGLVPWGAFVVLLSLVLAMSRGIERSQRVMCQAHLRQIGQGIALYIRDHRAYPSSLTPLVTDPIYDINVACFTCPRTHYETPPGASPEAIAADLFDKGLSTYIYIGAGLPLDAPADTVVAYEKSIKHHKDGINVLFADGHVEFLPKGPQLDFILNATTRPVILPPMPITPP